LAKYIDFAEVIHKFAAWKAKERKVLISQGVHQNSSEMLVYLFF